MATVLYWNINNYTDNRVSLAKTKKRKFDDEDVNSGPPGPQHMQLILDTIKHNKVPNTVNDQPVDFIVIVEIYNRKGVAVQGQLCDGQGLNGCLALRRKLGAGEWALVPPVVTGGAGQRESIAVFYRKANWYFLGPATWPQAYPQNLNRGLPSRTIPQAYPYRGGQSERRSAGRWQFDTWLPNAVPNFNNNPVLFPGASNRKPWLTAFGRVGNANLLVRLCAIHTQPDNAYQATANLADVYDMTARPPDAAQQIDVLLGDFNVSNLQPTNFQAGGAFGRLVGQGVNPVNPAYTALIVPPVGLVQNDRSYYNTHGIRPGDAEIMDGDENPVGSYPGYKYSNLSIDNALVRYQGLVAPAPHMTIVNRVVDTPYAAPAPPPPPPPPPPPVPMLGYYENVTAMATSIPNIFAMKPSPLDDLNTFFRSSDNYGRVYRVSDHFALLFDV